MMLVLIAFVFWLAMRGRLPAYAAMVSTTGNDPTLGDALAGTFGGIFKGINNASSAPIGSPQNPTPGMAPLTKPPAFPGGLDYVPGLLPGGVPEASGGSGGSFAGITDLNSSAFADIGMLA